MPLPVAVKIVRHSCRELVIVDDLYPCPFRYAGTFRVSPGFRTTTIESKTNIFRACAPGRLTGVAVPIHVGRRTIVLQTSIYRADGKLAAMMIQTQMVLPRGSATSASEGGG